MRVNAFFVPRGRLIKGSILPQDFALVAKFRDRNQTIPECLTTAAVSMKACPRNCRSHTVPTASPIRDLPLCRANCAADAVIRNHGPSQTTSWRTPYLTMSTGYRTLIASPLQLDSGAPLARILNQAEDLKPKP
jgi:hypothetical protein